MVCTKAWLNKEFETISGLQIFPQITILLEKTGCKIWAIDFFLKILYFLYENVYG